MPVEPVAIIGAGPAGLAAAIQLRRYGLAPLVFERAEVGGLLWNANLVENYPGFPGGIPGPELVRRMVEQARQHGVQVIRVEVKQLTYSGDRFTLLTEEQAVSCRVAVIASGTRPRQFEGLGIPADLQDRVLYEVAPLLDAVGKRIAIVGAGDAAFDYALNLARNNTVCILNRGERVKCLPLLWERASAAERITYHPNWRVAAVEQHPEAGLRLACETPQGRAWLPADYLIGALGRLPQVDFFSPEFLEAAPQLQQQGLLYWIGDVRNGLYRQTAIAVGDGLRAAMQIHQHTKELHT
ncbi:MAG: NAD(P)/FAD-dependent oxidoreductase [Anaerolineales bacterium]|nr:NAD(P)/FAD-dependent oxidoreductase [Anaerolineales bacterium]